MMHSRDNVVLLLERVGETGKSPSPAVKSQVLTKHFSLQQWTFYGGVVLGKV